MNKKASIIILNYYGKKETLECLCSLNQSGDTELFKIILVNNSPDERFSETELKKYFYLIDYICPDKNYGFAGGCNIGIKKALNDPECAYIMLLNNDTIVTRGAINRFIRHCDNQPDTLFNPVIVFYHTKKVQCTGGDFNLFFGYSKNINKNKNPADIKNNVEPYYLNGCCIFAEKNIFAEIGLFDERFFMYCEDLDLSARAKKAGYKLCAVKDILIYHKHSKSTDLSKKQFYICRNTVLFIRKNYNFIYAVLLLPLYFFIQLLIGVLVYKNKNIFALLNAVTAGFFAGFSKNKL
ncbi:glycosyltransferase family 2 protein [bacterium]|nr:glycosyltransferase family 2 protein [bacterium]